MKKSLKKILMGLLSVVMVMTALSPIAFAEEPANVTIAFADATMEAASSTGLRVTNLINQQVNNASVDGYYVQDGVITFNFSEAMNVDTLTPENIKITLENGNNIRGNDADKFNSETLEWTYEPYAKSATTYSIAISDMCEGIKKHTVKFTSGVKTAGNASITEVSKNFVTGRIATTQGFEGKILKDVACGKSVLHQNPPTGEPEHYYGVRYDKLTTYRNSYGWNTWAWIPGGWLKIDLGNYYNIVDVAAYLPGYINGGGVSGLDIRYSSDPNETGATAASLGSINSTPFELAYATKDSQGMMTLDNVGGLGASSWLHPATAVRARYIFIKSSLEHPNYANIGSVKVIATVESDYGKLTATKNGVSVESFDGAGDYVVSVPVTEYKEGSSDNYMIVAGYDENGVITKINCSPVTINSGVHTLTTTFTDATKSIKAVLIKNLTQPYMLTDSLELLAPASQE